MQGPSSNLEAILSYYTIRGISYETAYLCQTITWPRVGLPSANRATFANDESRLGSQSHQDWHVISPFHHTSHPPPPLSPFALPLTHTGPQQTNYLNCLGESNGRTFRP